MKKNIKKDTYPLVLVLWRDAYSQSGEMDADGVLKDWGDSSMWVKTVGLLVKKDDKNIGILTEWYPEDDASFCRALTIIPTSLVEHMDYLVKKMEV